ncbi:hypothetical protein PMAYCL1PPCAC_18628 [Pristionchus mayeri]|uniref:KAP NTPase domain-containing protein n=1 Tax=Pristionchus mayeri TaxID=1317129 RepID=A0AAN5I1K9_9BILA|nr:hypothetical protein PMAYCL1PPCAC_18628 [Pristionchus mayeri]
MVAGLNRRGGGGGTTDRSALSELASAMVGMAHTAAAPTQIDPKVLFTELEGGEWEHVHVPLALDGSSYRNEGGETFLIVASRNGYTECVEKLLKGIVDVDDTDSEGWSALLVAAFEGHANVVQQLIDAGATVDQPDLMGWSPLMWAVYKNHLDSVRTLIQSGAHVNLIDEEDGLTPLIVAAGRGFTEIVQILIEAEAQVNSLDKFGSTSLIWAARKGHLPVVQQLLNAGAELDVQGMHSSTALMLATKGNYADVVDILLSRDANTNAVDNNGLSALGIAAREGYATICEALINSGAFVNQSDRYGNCILASAVRSGNANIVKMLLDKYADVNSRDSESRTALHLAIDKGFMDIVMLLLDKKPNLELKNKDGETALLRAVKSRHVALCQLLVNAGAKISGTDNNGDNTLHLALRARSKRLTQTLLVNPSDSRLLYRPNKIGQTPYSIDQMNPSPILPHIFGPIDAENQMESILGYDVYSNVLADMVCEPSLTLPLTMGLYAKWGSGKSLLLSKLRESMVSFSRSWKDSLRLQWSWRFLVYLFVVVFLITLPIATVCSLVGSALTIVIFCLGLVTYLVLSFLYGAVYYGYELKGWMGTTATAANQMALFKAKALLLFNLLTSYAPLKDEVENDTYSNPVSFLFADYHRLSSIGGEQALAKIVSTLFEAAEEHYGVLAVRLFCAFHRQRTQQGRLRAFCGVPVILTATVIVLLFVAGCILMIIWLLNPARVADDATFIDAGGFLIASCVCFGLFLLLSIWPLMVAFVYSVTNMPKKRLNKAARQIHKLRFEGLMQKLQSEVDLLADLIHSLDGFTSSQTRLVVVVDGLDNCEQDKMVSTLDALELLFSARKNRPFIVIIAVDPHIIISALNHNMHSALSGTELTGHDYLKNIVNMPFYLHNSALRQLQNNLKEKRESLADWKERFRRQDTFHGSHLSLRDADLPSRGAQSRRMTMVVGTRSLNEQLLSDDYFSNLNPRAVRRIVNALALTGRLMRAFEVEFSWLSLGHWISLCEQWPSRMCWLIETALACNQPHMTLAEVYHQMAARIPKKDDLMGLDRNPENFEGFLESPAVPSSEILTVAHVRRFVPCTSNLDPYLRKQIRDRRDSLGEDSFKPPPPFTLPPNAKYLFHDESVWDFVDTPLVEMKIEEICGLMRKLDISQPRLDQIILKFQSMNLNGLVLTTCSMDELKQALQVNLGDWTMIKMLIDTLKAFGTAVPGSRENRRRKMTALSLREEEENELDGDYDLTLGTSPAPDIKIDPGSRKNTVIEPATEHNWLMQSLQELDETDEPREVVRSKTSSVRFDDEVEAHSEDSIESTFGSRENLLEIPPSPTNAPEATRERSSYMSQSFYRKMPRAELMRRAQGSSIHSMTSEGGESLLSNEEHQLTVRERQDGEEEGEKKTTLANLFRGQ